MFISNKAVGDHLRAARSRKGLTQATVAEQLGISEKHYGHIERGARTASLEMLGHLCSLFDTPLEELISGILVNPPSDTEKRTRDRQIKRIEKMLLGCSDGAVDMIAEIVESVTKYQIK